VSNAALLAMTSWMSIVMSRKTSSADSVRAELTCPSLSYQSLCSCKQQFLIPRPGLPLDRLGCRWAITQRAVIELAAGELRGGVR
jgi:hypothetical protein